ncbi:Uncharacterised protein [Mycobacteroides abscessus subsp. abscessus]|nr:Uncharacterised protein [Mycobacteroides abscessus subsp. abscessus]
MLRCIEVDIVGHCKGKVKRDSAQPVDRRRGDSAFSNELGDCAPDRCPACSTFSHKGIQGGIVEDGIVERSGQVDDMVADPHSDSGSAIRG